MSPQVGDELGSCNLGVGAVGLGAAVRLDSVGEPCVEEGGNRLPLGRDRESLLLIAERDLQLFRDLPAGLGVEVLPALLRSLVAHGDGPTSLPIRALLDA